MSASAPISDATPHVSERMATPGRFDTTAHSFTTRFMPSSREFTSSASHRSIATKACSLSFRVEDFNGIESALLRVSGIHFPNRRIHSRAVVAVHAQVRAGRNQKRQKAQAATQIRAHLQQSPERFESNDLILAGVEPVNPNHHQLIQKGCQPLPGRKHTRRMHGPCTAAGSVLAGNTRTLTTRPSTACTVCFL